MGPAFFYVGSKGWFDAPDGQQGGLKPRKDKPVELEAAFTVTAAKRKPRPLSRAEFLHRQIESLRKEAADLRKAGRLEEARQHEEKAEYRRGQLKALLAPEK